MQLQGELSRQTMRVRCALQQHCGIQEFTDFVADEADSDGAPVHNTAHRQTPPKRLCAAGKQQPLRH